MSALGDKEKIEKAAALGAATGFAQGAKNVQTALAVGPAKVTVTASVGVSFGSPGRNQPGDPPARGRSGGA